MACSASEETRSQAHIYTQLYLNHAHIHVGRALHRALTTSTYIHTCIIQCQVHVHVFCSTVGRYLQHHNFWAITDTRESNLLLKGGNIELIPAGTDHIINTGMHAHTS